ncbi:DJ-1/PfpI family protein [Halobacillus litoralis]|uniref:DJ-1/PfpI family protein n=1 Tax=Halobacillus litoralis TaxID=45668 RepID=UPI0024932A2D|nr:DJ-1/PfpI family protein [Halobacillus litoralis]
MDKITFTGILLYPRFSEYEISVLLSVLKQGRKQAIYIGLDNQVVRGESGLPCIPEASINEVDINRLDSIVLPGVDDFAHLINHDALASFIHKMNDQNKIIAAISSAPYLLSISGVLDGKKYTTGLTAEQRTFLGTFKEESYINSPIVVDEYASDS